jgi:hypothetical protein
MIALVIRARGFIHRRGAETLRKRRGKREF